MFSQVSGGRIDVPWSTAREAGLVVLAAADGASGQDSRVVAILFAIFFGAMCGSIAGLIVQRLLRFAVYMAGRNFQGNFLILFGAVAGIALLVWRVVTHGTF